MSYLNNCENKKDDSNKRSVRKIEHLHNALNYCEDTKATGLSDVHLVHNCLTQVNFSEIDVSVDVAGIKVGNPIFINAITGGATETEKVNELLAEIAQSTGCCLAVGSQCAGVLDQSLSSTYSVVRKKNPRGIIFANIGAYANVKMALDAIDMIEADALQIHLNAAQEIIMPEGDRDFTDVLKNIESIVRLSPVPVIVKETGCGMAKEQVEILLSIGVRVIDVGGFGGTNFIAIENMRSTKPCESEFLQWGIPTVISIVEAKCAISSMGNKAEIMASGGIRSALDMVKVLALGASSVGVAKPILQEIELGEVEKSVEWLNRRISDIKKYMLLLGVKNIAELQSVPIVITGFVKEWLDARCIETKKLYN